MECPCCGEAMRAGCVAYAPQTGLYFLPPDRRLPWGITRQGIKNSGGVVLDHGKLFGFLQGDGTLPAHICEACRKIVMEY